MQLSANSRMDKLWYICTMKYVPAIKMNKLLLRATAWMNLINKMLSGKCKTQKNIQGLNISIQDSRKGKTLLFKGAYLGIKQ